MKRVLFGLGYAALAFFLLIACVSYNPTDLSLFYYQTNYAAVHNWAGLVGAHVAALLVYLSGLAAYGLSFLMAIGACALLGSRAIATQADRLAALAVLMIVCSVLCALFGLDYQAPDYPGGLIGQYTASLLLHLFDRLGTMIFLTVLLWAGLLILTRFALIQVVIRCCTPMRGLFSRAKKFFLARQKFDQQIDQVGQIQDDLQDNFWDYFVQQQESVPSWHTLESINHGSPAPEQAMGQGYKMPPLSIFETDNLPVTHKHDAKEMDRQAAILQEKLACFGVTGSVVAIRPGPVVTLFEYQPSIDSKLSKIVSLEDDLAMALQASSIRIIAPIPGKSVVGFEISNKERQTVLLTGGLSHAEFKSAAMRLPVVLGQDIIGHPVIIDIVHMPHLLVAGSTGSGKSMCLNSILVSILASRSPDAVRLVLIDPKQLEFSRYADVAHLLLPIVTTAKAALSALSLVVKIMHERYEQMAAIGARSIFDCPGTLPFIVIIIDELADLMMSSGKEVEDLITRIAQMARAAGIHMIVATQRPSVDVITGLIKVNFPSRIACRVTSKVDSRTILDCNGAQNLLGKGDMLFLDSRASCVRRVHGAYIADQQIHALVDYIKNQQVVQYRQHTMDDTHDIKDQEDVLYGAVRAYLQEVDEISISSLQRKFKIGYNRSARIMETLESHGLILRTQSGKQRKVIK